MFVIPEGKRWWTLPAVRATRKFPVCEFPASHSSDSSATPEDPGGRLGPQTPHFGRADMRNFQLSYEDVEVGVWPSKGFHSFHSYSPSSGGQHRAVHVRWNL